MKKPTYQPIIIERCNNIITLLRDSKFFKDYEITDETYAFNYICGKLTDKFILGELSDDLEDPVFTENEFNNHLNLIISGSLIYGLQKKGLIDSIEDENNEEVFFLTNLGNEISRMIKEN